MVTKPRCWIPELCYNNPTRWEKYEYYFMCPSRGDVRSMCPIRGNTGKPVVSICLYVTLEGLFTTRSPDELTIGVL